ncbi:BatD family protein (plasmid) [Agrobacterium tumefaciens]|uniref:BatD family protein n=1 Tax=Agrobacterium tumefaciens TaxID=358 RepID=UPI0015724F56|nr:BatD family protein [Agrobacterium tumefaciens]NSZ66938.1 protein BatD [Agrobacterium tumefaciens]NTA73136.1 protein BatD [Agrobacterium tumefaciens]WIE41672.1 BatD family protein [Agrobacterium tumefaciens]
MRTWLCLCAFLRLVTVSLAAEPFASATIDIDGPIVVGQQVHVTVEVFVPDFFTAPPDIPLFDIPDATVTIPDERAQNTVKTVDGAQYSGIGKSFVVVPERTGLFSLPPFNIGVSYSKDGKPVSKQVSLTSTSFTVVALPGITQTSDLNFTARDVTIDQSFDRDTSSLRVGDALVRTITVSALDTQAMMIPAIVSPQADGLKIYARDAKLEDTVRSRDRSSGSIRIETITYVAEKTGRLQLPAISYPWYDLDAHANEIATLPSVEITVADSEPSPTTIPPKIERLVQTEKSPVPLKVWAAILCALAALLLVLWAVWHNLPTLRKTLHNTQQTILNSEPRRFRQLMVAIKNDDPKAIYSLLEVWTRRFGFQSIGRWLSATGDENVTRDVSNLERTLFSAAPSDGIFDRSSLRASLKTVRSRMPRPVRRKSRAALPELNPAGLPD